MGEIILDFPGGPNHIIIKAGHREMRPWKKGHGEATSLVLRVEEVGHKPRNVGSF